MEETPSLGQALLEEVKRRGISQSEAARDLGVARQAFSDWVNGKRIPSEPHAAALARFLRIPKTRVRALMIHPRADRITVLETKVAKLEASLAQVTKLAESLAEMAPKMARGQSPKRQARR